MLVAPSCLTLCDSMDIGPSGSSCPWDFPGKNTGVACHSLLQGIFPTQGSNPCLLHWQADSLPLSHQGSPQIIIFLWKSVNSLEKDTLRMYKQPIYLQTLTLSTYFQFLFSTIITVVSQ